MLASDPARQLDYAKRVDPDAARVEETEDGPVLVLPAESISSSWFGIVVCTAVTAIGTAWAFAVATKWLHPEWSPSWRARQLFAPVVLILLCSLGAVFSYFDLRARRRGQPRQLRLLLRPAGVRTGRHSAPAVSSVEVRRLYFPLTLGPRWGLRVTYGRSLWTWGRQYHAVGTDRLHAEHLAAELRRLLGLAEREGSV